MKEKLTGYPSIDKPWLKYFNEEERHKEIPECTVWQNIYQKNKENLSQTAIYYYGNKITYETLFQKVTLCASALLQNEVKRGDCISLCTSGVPEAIYLALACSRIGAIANFVNPLFSKEEMVERINDTESKLLFVMDEMYSYVEKALSKLHIKKLVILPVSDSFLYSRKVVYELSHSNKQMFKNLLNEKINFVEWRHFIDVETKKIDETYQKNSPCIMVYSSGTTGASKGITLTNDGINATIAIYDSDDFCYEKGKLFLQMIPIWFSTGIVLSTLMPIYFGITVISELVFSKENFMEDIVKYQPTMTLAATSLWLYVARNLKNERIDLRKLSYPITGGEAITMQEEHVITNFLKECGCTSRLIKGYGMCELGSTITSTRPQYGKYESVGYPALPQILVAAFDEDTDKELIYGERGEIRVCSPAAMLGYYRNTEATEKFFYTDEDGRRWGCTGDIGYVDEDGFVFIEGRKNEYFARHNGKKLYLFDVEKVALSDAAVSQCEAVITELGKKRVLILHILLQEKNQETSQVIVKRISESYEQKLPECAKPNYYKIRTSFPVHASGKRNVEALKEEIDGLLDSEGKLYESNL